MTGPTPLIQKYSMLIPRNLGPKKKAPGSAGEDAGDGSNSGRSGKDIEQSKGKTVDSATLYQVMNDSTARFRRAINEAQAAGPDDPFDSTPVREHVDSILKRYNPNTQLDKAMILYISIIDPSRTVKIEGGKYDGMTFRGLREDEGGLGVRKNPNFGDSRREKLGSLSPREIMALPKGERIALCLEFSYLMVASLGEAGIEAQVVEEPGHALVVARLDGEEYQLDLMEGEFIKLEGDASAEKSGSGTAAPHYTNEGIAFAENGKFDKAMSCFERAIEIDPNYARARASRGHLLARLGRYEEAMEDYERAMEIDPDDFAANYGRGIRFAQLGRYDEAMQDYDRALGSHPDHADTLFQKGLILAARGQHQESLAYFERALKGKPDDLDILYSKGYALARLGRQEEAIECYDEVLERNPDYAAARIERRRSVAKQKEDNKIMSELLQIERELGV
jgi:tetratricopeptide (TPR) repeat protein